jgi:hypothetical protein
MDWQPLRGHPEHLAVAAAATQIGSISTTKTQVPTPKEETPNAKSQRPNSVVFLHGLLVPV